jgi:hypothetical protein
LMEGMRSIYATTQDFKGKRKTQYKKSLKTEPTDKNTNSLEEIKSSENKIQEKIAIEEPKALFDKENIPSLKEILLKTSPWKQEFLYEAKIRKDERDEKRVDPNRLVKQNKAPLDSSEKTEETPLLASASDRFEAYKRSPNIKDEVSWSDGTRHTPSEAKDAELRWSSPLYFPWLGADDPQGLQLGLISVPLIDDLQNHTVRATVLVGVNSLYPQVDVTYSNRSNKWPLDTSVYQKLTYNGQQSPEVNYWDDKGVVVSTAKAKRKFGLLNTLRTGWKSSYLSVYSGLEYKNQGLLNEPFVTLSTSKSLPYRFSTSVSLGLKYAGELINENFDYYKLSLGFTASKGVFTRGRIRTGVSYAQTRGTKLMFLREYYTPLKTYIPGSGGGLNQSNFNIAGDGTLFSVIFGDSKLRYNIDFSTPIIADIDKSLWIFYAERLDFSAFFNYGGIWDTLNETPYADVDFIAAHGYHIDLQLENKGVRFNVGVGLGQVFGYQFNIYGKFGFDAFF